MDGGSIDYATSKDWLDIMKNRSKLRMHELIERLGLRAKWSQNKRGKTNFESGLVRDLVTDMGDVVATLPKEQDELVKFLSVEGSLKEEVEGLLQKHGSAIWGRAGDREHLISTGEPGVEEGIYPRDLYFENEEDREQIRILLHWWLGMKAINVILARERLDRERKKKEENRRARIELEHHPDGAPSSFVALAPHAGSATMPALNTKIPSISSLEGVRHLQALQSENASRGSPMSTSMVTPPESSESPIVTGRGSIGNTEGSHFTAVNAHPLQAGPIQGTFDGSRHGSVSSQPAMGAPSWSAVNSAPQPAGSRRTSAVAMETAHQTTSQPIETSHAAMQQLSADLSKLISDLTPEIKATVNGHSTSNAGSQALHDDVSRPYQGLDVNTLQALRAYIYQEPTNVTWDEDALLRQLERTWREGVRSDHNRIRDNPLVFIARERAFLTWIELKRHLADLDRADKRWREEGTTAPEIERRIQQHKTLMGATKELIRSWDGIGHIAAAGADKDELLRQAFVVLAGDKYAVELQWKTVDFTGVVQWLAQHLESFSKEEEEEGEGVYYFG